MTDVKRSYRSPRREAQAARTRDAILESVGRLLRSGGLGAATMDAIAADAGVSVQTVYAAYGSKPGILKAMLARLEAEADPDRLLADLRAAPRPLVQLRAIVAYHRRLYERGAGTLAATIGSASTDADIAGHVASGHRRRRAAQRELVRRWDGEGVLRPGVGAREAADVLWALTSPELYLLQVDGSGWTSARYERWLSATLETLLFGDLVRAGS